MLVFRITERPVLIERPNYTVSGRLRRTESDMVEGVINPLIIDIIIQYHVAEKNILSIAVICLIAILIAKSQHSLPLLAEVTFIVGRTAFFNLNRTDIDREIEPDGFAPGETQKVGNLLRVTGNAAGCNPLAHIGEGYHRHNGCNDHHDEQLC